MATRKVLMGLGVVAALAGVGLLAGPLAAEEGQANHAAAACCGTGGEMVGTAAPTNCAGCPMMDPARHQEQAALVDRASQSVDAALQALQNDNREQAVQQLQAAKEALASHQEHMKQAGNMMRQAALRQAGVVNDRCPIMGSPIQPQNVQASLTREFNGQKVAFCCGGCPAQWDRLSEQERQAKLDSVRMQSAPTGTGTASQGQAEHAAPMGQEHMHSH